MFGFSFLFLCKGIWHSLFLVCCVPKIELFLGRRWMMCSFSLKRPFHILNKKIFIHNEAAHVGFVDCLSVCRPIGIFVVLAVLQPIIHGSLCRFTACRQAQHLWQVSHYEAAFLRAEACRLCIRMACFGILHSSCWPTQGRRCFFPRILLFVLRKFSADLLIL